MKFNSLNMIWNVKIFLAKIKDCKGRDLKFSAKKKMPTKTPPKKSQKTALVPFWAITYNKIKS